MFNISKDFAPPFKLIEPFFKYGTILYLISFCALFFIDSNASFADFKIVGWAHLFLLGFVMIIIFGAMAQLVPVALEVGHFAVDLYYIIFPTLFIGAILLVGGFWFAPGLIPYGGLLVFISMVTFLFETFATLKKTNTNTLTVKSVKYGNIFLTAAIVIGLIMALVIGEGFAINISNLLPIHAVLVLFGYVLITIIGLSMILLPMFGLSHGYKDDDVNLSFKILTYSILAFVALKLLFLDTLAYIALIGIFVSIIFYLKQIVTLYKIRARKVNDIWYMHLYSAYGAFVAFLILGAIWYISGSEAILKSALWFLIVGFFGFMINGHLLKIIPFLVWFERFSPLVGKKKVPMLHEMLPNRDTYFEYYFATAGLVVAGIGLLFSSDTIFKGGVTLLCFSAIFMLKSVIYILNLSEEDYV